MFDLRWIRDNPTAFDQGRARRGLAPLSAQVLELDQKKRAAQTRFQESQAKRNALSRQIGQVKAKGGAASAVMAEVAAQKDGIAAAEAEEQAIGAELDALLAAQPNLPADDVPDGPDESFNRVERTVGAGTKLGEQARPALGFGEA